MDDRHGRERQVRDRWDANATEWARQIRAGEDVYRERFLEPAFMRFVGPLEGLEVLDAGCGEGTSSRVLARAKARVSAMDLSPAMIASALSVEQAAPLGISYFQASVDSVPFPEARSTASPPGWP